MNFTYHITLANLVQEDVRAASAGQAIYEACHRNRGQRVIACYAGGDPDPDCPPPFNVPGRQTFEIPPHDPLPLEPEPGRQLLCARYIQVGDLIRHDGLALRVLEIRELPVKRAFYCNPVGGFSGPMEIAIRPTQLLEVTRPEKVGAGSTS